MRRLAATALTLAAMVLAPAVHAEPDPAPPVAPVDAPSPLGLRPSKPLELAREPEHLTLGWKLVGVLVILGATVVYFRRRAGAKGPRDLGLTIVRRTTIGLRSELLVVNVEGQRLLLGVTPHSIQSIAVLDSEAPAAPPALAEESLGDRFAGIIDAAERSVGPNPLRPRAMAALPEADDDADQATGLRALRRGQ